jgi:hypothetical protein
MGVAKKNVVHGSIKPAENAPGAKKRVVSITIPPPPKRYFDEPLAVKQVPHLLHALGYQNLSAEQLADRFCVPRGWILENSKAHKTEDPIPHIHLRKHKRYRWGSPDLAEWIERRVISQYSFHRAGPEEAVTYEFLDSAQLAARLNISESWVREQVRTRATEPIPHMQFGKYIRFRWGSPELETWAERRMVSDNNRTVGRTQGKE